MPSSKKSKSKSKKSKSKSPRPEIEGWLYLCPGSASSVSKCAISGSCEWTKRQASLVGCKLTLRAQEPLASTTVVDMTGASVTVHPIDAAATSECETCIAAGTVPKDFGMIAICASAERNDDQTLNVKENGEVSFVLRPSAPAARQVRCFVLSCFVLFVFVSLFCFFVYLSLLLCFVSLFVCCLFQPISPKYRLTRGCSDGLIVSHSFVRSFIHTSRDGPRCCSVRHCP